MISLSCPSCGATVDFLSKVSVFAVCSFCKSSLVRQDLDLQAIGKMAELQDDLTPLQIGTKGTYDGNTFELIGRMRIAWFEKETRDPDTGAVIGSPTNYGGFWNEWYALYAGEEECWLAEAQGFYAICFPFKGRLDRLPFSSNIRPGLRVNLDERTSFEVEDIKQVNCILAEGELPLQAMQGRKAMSVDLSSHDGDMGTIEYPEFGWEPPTPAPPSSRTKKLRHVVKSFMFGLENMNSAGTSQQAAPEPGESQPQAVPPLRAFVGTYLEFDEFKFVNYRKIDGW